MTTTERRLLAKYDMAAAAFHRAPSYETVSKLYEIATKLVDISDDWQDLVDMCADELAEYEEAA